MNVDNNSRRSISARWHSASQSHLSAANSRTSLGPIEEGRFVASGRGSIGANLDDILSQPFCLPGSYASLRRIASGSRPSMTSSRSSMHTNASDTQRSTTLTAPSSSASVVRRMNNGYSANTNHNNVQADKPVSAANASLRYSVDALSLQSDTSTIKGAPVDRAATLGRQQRQKHSSLVTGPFSGYSATGTLKKMSAGSEMSLMRRRKKMTGANNMLPDREITQVEVMYQSQATKVFVCRCLANLYYSHVDAVQTGKPDWDLRFTGIPMVMLDMGSAKSRRTRQLQLILAEKGTGFALWRDNIDTLSKLTEIEKTFQTLCHSKDHRVVIGLSYDNSYAAGEMFGKLKDFISELVETRIEERYAKIKDKPSVERRKSLNAATREKRNWLRKANISTPCCFTYVTSIRPAELLKNEFRSSENGSSFPGSSFPTRSSSISVSHPTNGNMTPVNGETASLFHVGSAPTAHTQPQIATVRL